MSAFDPTVALRYVEAAYPGDVAGVLSVSHIEPGGAFKAGQQFARHDIGGLLHHVAALDARGCPSIYLRNTTVAPGTVGRGTAVDSVELPFVTGDVDFGADGHSAKNNPPDVES